MKTKNIFNMLAFAMLMPTMLLTTACSNDDDIVNNSETTIKKGYALPFTVDVTRGDDATRATYDVGTKMLSFSAGDKLFVKGHEENAGDFAGTLDYDVSNPGRFSGTIYTENSTSRPVVEVVALAQAEGSSYSECKVEAVLLPNGYESKGFISISGEGTYGADLTFDYENAFATDKAEAVEQFSYEKATTYSSGFALHPQNPILKFVISNLTKNAIIPVELQTSNQIFVSKNVTTDDAGTATFYTTSLDQNSKEFTLNVGGQDLSLNLSGDQTKSLVAGHIYTIPRSATLATGYDIKGKGSLYNEGDVVGSDGKAYKPADRFFLPSGVVPAGMVAKKAGQVYVVALHDCASEVAWADIQTTAESYTPAVSDCTWRVFFESEWHLVFRNEGYFYYYDEFNRLMEAAGGDILHNDGDPEYWMSEEYGEKAGYFKPMLLNKKLSFKSGSKTWPRKVRAGFFVSHK